MISINTSGSTELKKKRKTEQCKLHLIYNVLMFQDFNTQYN